MCISKLFECIQAKINKYVWKRQKDGLRDDHILILGTWEHITILGERGSAGVTKLKTLGWGEFFSIICAGSMQSQGSLKGEKLSLG